MRLRRTAPAATPRLCLGALALVALGCLALTLPRLPCILLPTLGTAPTTGTGWRPLSPRARLDTDGNAPPAPPPTHPAPALQAPPPAPSPARPPVALPSALLVPAFAAAAAATLALLWRRLFADPADGRLRPAEWVMAGGGGPNPNDAPWEYEGPPDMKLKMKFVDRKDLMQAPYYQRRLLMSSPLSREMREKYGVRTMPVRKGDEVRVRVGEFAGIEGRVNRTYHQKLLVFVDGVDVRKSDHSRKKIGLDAAKLEIVDLYMDDKRKKVLLRKLAREPMSKGYRDDIVDAYPI